MTGGRRADVACRADLYRLHIHRFARGTYPEACGHTESMPVNRCFMPLSNPSGAECYLEDDNTHFTLTPGNAYFIPLNYPVRLRLDEYLTFVSIQFTLELYEGIDIFSAVKRICELPGTHWKEAGKRAFECSNINVAAAMLHTIVFDFSSTLMPQMTNQEWNPVTKFSNFQPELDFIHSNKKKLASITVSDLANVRSFSREYFTRTFTRITGISPKQFLTDLLVNETKRLLVQEDISIKEVANLLGFSSEFYFSKFCSKHTQLSPKQYRIKFMQE